VKITNNCTYDLKLINTLRFGNKPGTLCDTYGRLHLVTSQHPNLKKRRRESFLRNTHTPQKKKIKLIKKQTKLSIIS